MIMMLICVEAQYCEITLPQYNGCSFCAIKSEEGNDAELQTALYRGAGKCWNIKLPLFGFSEVECGRGCAVKSFKRSFLCVGRSCGHFWSFNLSSSHDLKFKSSHDDAMRHHSWHSISTHLTALPMRGQPEKPEKLPKSFGEASNFATAFTAGRKDSRTKKVKNWIWKYWSLSTGKRHICLPSRLIL